MTTLSRSASLLATRTSLAFVVLSLASLGAWTAGDLLGQAPNQKKERIEEEEEPPKTKAPPGPKKRVEEEEEAPKKKQKRKVIRVDEEENKKTQPEAGRAGGSEASGDLTQAAEKTNHPDLRAFFRSLAVPYEAVLYKRSSILVNGERPQRGEERIEPTPAFLGNDPGRFGQQRLHFRRLAPDKKGDKDFSEDPERLVAVRCYEEIALEKVKSFLREKYDERGEKDPLYLSRDAMLTAAEQALSFVLSWHQSAIQTGKRSGKDWDEVEKKLRSYLFEVLLEQMKELARSKDWNGVLELTHHLVKNYGNTDDERIFRPVVEMIQQALNDAISDPSKKRDTFKRLHDLEMEFPNNPLLQSLSKPRQAYAKSLLDQAEHLAKDREDARKLQLAREYLKEAEETWPQLQGVGKLRRQIGRDYPILHVGMRDPLPKYFSPAWACTDNERRALELLFESLVKLVPDGLGGFRYRPCLAESPAKVKPLGRQFDLPRNAFWSNGKPLTAGDIQNSLEFVKIGKGVGLSRVWGDLLEDKIQSMKNPFQPTLKMKQGFLDTLAPMSFKIVRRDEQKILTEEFARNPVTSGPFLLDLDRSGQSDETRRLALIFVANPAYSQRPTKHGTPHIQEIRFYSYGENTDLAKELASRNLDLVLDLTAKQAEGLQRNQNTDIMVPLPSPAVPNRRIYFLAINTRKLEDPKLRQALSLAIDRERLLNEHFRGSLKGLHKALGGPFPAGSWACKPAREGNKESQTLFDPELAKLQKPQGKVGPFHLKYAADNPAVDEAMKDLCAQVKELTGVVLEPTPRTPYQLREDVEKAKDYELAYYHYDFPDECYWLAPLFGPPPGTEDTNIFKYNNPDLSRLLDGVKGFRDFAKVREYQWSTQEFLNREMPFIPLWQLDPLLAYRRDVQPSAFDPLLVFDNIEEWHLIHK